MADLAANFNDWERAEIVRSDLEARHTPSHQLRMDETQIARYMSPSAESEFPLEYAYALLGDIRGRTVLDLGCGSGENSVLLARRGDDLGAARHKERAMEALRDQGQGRTLTRVKGDRTYTNDEVRDQLWAEIHWHYFRAARAAGDKAEMDKRLTGLIALTPDDVDIALDAIPALIERGRKEDAAKLFAKPYAILRAAVDEKPDDLERMNSLAWLCARSNQRLDEALKLITTALKAQPDNYAYLDTAAEVHFQLGNVDQAIALEMKANEINPGNEFLRSQLKRFQAKSNTGSAP